MLEVEDLFNQWLNFKLIKGNITMSNNNNQKFNKNNKKEFIDFKKLSEKELENLSQKWEHEATVFDKKLDSYMSNPNPNSEKCERLWKIGNQLWSRLRKLENFRKSRNRQGRKSV